MGGGGGQAVEGVAQAGAVGGETVGGDLADGGLAFEAADDGGWVVEEGVVAALKLSAFDEDGHGLSGEAGGRF